jgi:hypothetical protein
VAVVAAVAAPGMAMAVAVPVVTASVVLVSVVPIAVVLVSMPGRVVRDRMTVVATAVVPASVRGGQTRHHLDQEQRCGQRQKAPASRRVNVTQGNPPRPRPRPSGIDLD